MLFAFALSHLESVEPYAPCGASALAPVKPEGGEWMHLNARYHPKPTVPHFTHDYGDGNVWCSLTPDEHRAMGLNSLLHGVDGVHSIPRVYTC